METLMILIDMNVNKILVTTHDIVQCSITSKLN